MDNQRPELDLKYVKDICPDKNGTYNVFIDSRRFVPLVNISTLVPVIVVFTKYDQFLRNVQINLEDYGNPDDNVLDVATRRFKKYYLRHLGDDVRFVQLQSKLISDMELCQY